MPARLFEPMMLEFSDGTAFAVKRIDAMEARPATTTLLEPVPSAFVWTGYREVSLTMPLAAVDAAYAVMLRNGHQPCTLVRGDERFAFAFVAQSLNVTPYDANLGRDGCGGELDGLLYEKAVDGQPVTDEAMIVYLTEKYKPREYTAEELAELAQYADWEE
jgi:hypothetical protein